jgi:hypothetical protein
MADSPQRTAQVTLISILQALPVAVLVTHGDNEALLSADVSLAEAAYALTTAFIVALATYVLLAEVLSVDWGMPVYQPFIWFAFAGVECVMAANVSAEQREVWHWAYTVLGVIVVVAYGLNHLICRGWKNCRFVTRSKVKVLNQFQTYLALGLLGILLGASSAWLIAGNDDIAWYLIVSNWVWPLLVTGEASWHRRI